jgi:hypothetical protein
MEDKKINADTDKKLEIGTGAIFLPAVFLVYRTRPWGVPISPAPHPPPGGDVHPPKLALIPDTS